MWASQWSLTTTPQGKNSCNPDFRGEETDAESLQSDLSKSLEWCSPIWELLIPSAQSKGREWSVGKGQACHTASWATLATHCRYTQAGIDCTAIYWLLRTQRGRLKHPSCSSLHSVKTSVCLLYFGTWELPKVSCEAFFEEESASVQLPIPEVTTPQRDVLS